MTSRHVIMGHATSTGGSMMRFTSQSRQCSFVSSKRHRRYQAQLTASQRGITKSGGLSNTLWVQKGQWAEKGNSVTYIYHLQTKFVKVMFSQVCVCPQGCAWLWGVCMAAGGRGVGVVKGGHAWWRGACVVKRGMHGKGGHAWQRGGMCGEGGHAWNMTRYSQWAGGTHPTGMHSCFQFFSLYSIEFGAAPQKIL